MSVCLSLLNLLSAEGVDVVVTLLVIITGAEGEVIITTYDTIVL